MPTLTAIVVMAGLAAITMAVFGLPPVDVHGPWHYLGVMDPLCGMTRAVLLLARAHIARAVEYNPASPLLAAFGAVVLVRAAVGRSTGDGWNFGCDGQRPRMPRWLYWLACCGRISSWTPLS